VSAGKTTLLIADDQALVRVGLRKILESEPETAVVGEVGDGQDAVAAARRLRPDVVLMDIRMPVLDGIEATRRIVRAQPATRVLILTTFGLDDYVYDALRAGASGFMLKDAPPEEIAAAVRIVASGDALLAPAITRAVIEEFARVPVRPEPAIPGRSGLVGTVYPGPI
jgi:DNA-binding NarL/FixJ family response regulator